jgi:hypothetical protein
MRQKTIGNAAMMRFDFALKKIAQAQLRGACSR